MTALAIAPAAAPIPEIEELGGWGQRPDPRAPRYVHGCHREECSLLLWRPGELARAEHGRGHAAVRVPARCGSWRHGGPCRRKRAAVDFARIRAALEPYQARDLVFFVLTLDREGSSGGRPYASREEAYRALSGAWRDFRRRLDRRYVRLPEIGAGIGRRWVCVVEQHRSGWPHLNVVCVSPELARRARARERWARETGRTRRQGQLIGPELREHALAAGFGEQSTLEAVRNREALAGYFVKLGGDLDAERGDWGIPEEDRPAVARMVAETAKMLQVPTAAPRGFRRLRSGPGFLPPRWKRSGWTGVLVDLFGRLIGRSKAKRRGELPPHLRGVTVDAHRDVVWKSTEAVATLPPPRGPP